MVYLNLFLMILVNTSQSYIKEGAFAPIKKGVYFFDRRGKKLKKITKTSQKRDSSNRIKLDHNMVIMIECNQADGEFGHFGACFYEYPKSVMNIFESMYSNTIRDPYMDYFKSLIDRYFNTDTINFVEDVYQ